MNIFTLSRLTAAIGVAVLAGGAHAASVVSATPTFAPTTELIAFDGYDGLVYESATYPLGLYLDNDGDVLLTTTDGGALVGAFAQDLEGNGLWGARFDPTSTGSGNFLSATAPINFNFGADGPQARVGAYFNLSQPLEGAQTNSITLTAYGYADLTQTSFVELESFSHVVNTDPASYNEGTFLGFQRTQADIVNFTVSFSGGGSMVMDDLHLSMAPIPEPGTYAMLLGGLGLVGWIARRRKVR